MSRNFTLPRDAFVLCFDFPSFHVACPVVILRTWLCLKSLEHSLSARVSYRGDFVAILTTAEAWVVKHTSLPQRTSETCQQQTLVSPSVDTYGIYYQTCIGGSTQDRASHYAHKEEMGEGRDSAYVLSICLAPNTLSALTTKYGRGQRRHCTSLRWRYRWRARQSWYALAMPLSTETK